MGLATKGAVTEKGLKNAGSKVWQVYLKYTMIFILVSGVIFSQFALYGKTLIWKTDGFLQWYPLMAKLKSFTTDFLSGNGFDFWSWDTGLGADWLGNYALIFCDPFNYLVMFFSKEKLDVAYSVIMIVKMYAAGVAMLAFLRYHRKSEAVCMMGSIGYALCAWSLISSRHDFFITQLILFPLIVLGVDKIEDKKSPLTLIFSVMLSVVNSLYFSYMTALFVAIYIVIGYFTGGGRKTAGDFLKKLFRYILYAVLGGVFLSAPVLVPTLYALTNTSTGSGVDIQILPTIKQLIRYIPGFAGNYDINYNYSIAGMNMLFVAMIPAMFLLRKKKRLPITMFFISMAVTILPVLQIITNGFSYASGRWSYILCFFFVYAAAECLESDVIHSEAYRRGAVIGGIVLLGATVLAAGMKAISVTELMIILLNMLFGVFCYSLLRRKDLDRGKRMNWLAGTVFVNVAIIPFLWYHPNIVSGIDIFMPQGKCYEIYESSSLKAAKAIKDKDFYRVDSVENPYHTGGNTPYTHTPSNTNIYWEVPSLFEYLSTLDSHWLEFNHALGNNSGYYRRMCAFSNDNRSRMDYLLGVRYFLGDNDTKGYKLSQYAGYGYQKKKEIDGVSILKSEYETSLGYVYDSVIPDSKYTNYTPLEKEQILMQSAELADEDAEELKLTPITAAEELQTETQQIPVTVNGSKGAVLSGGKISVKQENSSVTLTLGQEIRDSEVYVVFRNLKKNPYSLDQLWQIRQQKETEEDPLVKKKFYSSNLSYHPYGDFSILISKDNVTKRLVNAEGEPQGIRDIGDYMVNLGYRENCSGEIACKIENIGEYTYDAIEVIAVPQDGFRKQAAKLENNRLQVTAYDADHVTGTIDTEKGGLLYLNILYNDGWSISVDGKKVDRVYRTNTAFTGIEVTPGYHKIELSYRPVGYPVTVVLFVIGAAGICLTEVFRRKKSGGEEQ